MHEKLSSTGGEKVCSSRNITLNMPESCKSCGCICSSCNNEQNSYLDLHQKIAELHSQLQRSNNHISSLELELIESRQNTDLEVSKVKEELLRLRERYDRLLESHKKMQKVNHDLEDKLLKMVTRAESEKISLQQEISTMMNKLVDARILITQLDEENDKYRSDCNMAVQLLQCKPSTFVAHKLNSLPIDLQERVKQHMTRDQLAAAEKYPFPEEQKLIRVPIATFPPTAMVYSLNHNAIKSSGQQQGDQSNGCVPMSLIAQVLNHRQSRKKIPRMFLCNNCRRDVHLIDNGCQIDLLPVKSSRTVEISVKDGSHLNRSMFSGVSASTYKSSFISSFPTSSNREHRLSIGCTDSDY